MKHEMVKGQRSKVNGQWSKLRLSESRAMLASAMPSVSRFDVKHQWSMVNKNGLLNDQTTNFPND